MQIAFRTAGGMICQQGDTCFIGARNPDLNSPIKFLDVNDPSTPPGLVADRIVYTLYSTERHLPFMALANPPVSGDLAVATVPGKIADFSRDRSHTWDGANVVQTDWTPASIQAPVNHNPKVKTKDDFESWVVERMGTKAAWQGLLEKCAAHTGTADKDKNVRYFARWAVITDTFSRSDFEEATLPLTLVSPKIILVAARTAAITAW